MTERRYDEDEVAEIFGRASVAEDAVRQHPAPSEGMTLAELQAIGAEAGIAPERVAEAARALIPAGPRMTRRLLGITIGVGRTIEFDRRLTDEEWERVVVLLRETFDARGTLRAQGSLREWTNGNLQALLEPTAQGHRVRLRTVHGSARALMSVGIGLLSIAGVLGAVTAVTTGAVGLEVLDTVGGLSIGGAGAFLAGVLRLTGWSRERRRQMDQIAAQLQGGASPPFDPRNPT